jgi:uncharacterized Rmd1/YagE family protein
MKGISTKTRTVLIQNLKRLRCVPSQSPVELTVIPAKIQIYNQISLIPDGTARRDALRLTKKKAKSLPRVTAYATAK